jgi:hypothetical protein
VPGVNLLDLTRVVPGPRLFFHGTDPTTSTLVHTAVYSGYVVLTRNQGFRGMVRADMVQPISFYLPDSLPYQDPPGIVGAEFSLRKITSDPSPDLVTFGVSDEHVVAAPDPRGGGTHWLHVSFHTPVYGHRLVEINYRVTVRG